MARFGTGGNICGQITLATTAAQKKYRKRGRHSLASGCGETWAAREQPHVFNSSRNLNLPPGVNNHNFIQYREIPSLNATGGTAVIIPDNNYVKGRSASINFNNNDNDTNAGWTFGTGMECMLARCVEDRWYQIKSTGPVIAINGDSQVKLRASISRYFLLARPGLTPGRCPCIRTLRTPRRCRCLRRLVSWTRSGRDIRSTSFSRRSTHPIPDSRGSIARLAQEATARSRSALMPGMARGP